LPVASCLLPVSVPSRPPCYLWVARVDVLTNSGFQRTLPSVLVIVAAAGAVMVAGGLWSVGRARSASARVLRRRVAAIGLFVAVAAGAAYGVLSMPVEPEPGRAASETPAPAPEEEVSTARRFSSARLPALSLDAPDGWTLALDGKGRKLSASGDGARLLISAAVLAGGVDVPSLLQQMADSQRTLGFDVGVPFSDRIGDLPAMGFLATGPTRSVCTWMIKRDTHLATSIICSADGKVSAREACRPVIAKVQWRAPSR